MARNRNVFHAVVQLLVRLLAPPDRVDGIVDALRAVMRPAQQARGCSFAGVFVSASDRRRVVYAEDWDDPDELYRQFGTARFHRLLELLEIASEPPVVEFRVVSETHGLEYVSSQRPNELLGRV